MRLGRYGAALFVFFSFGSVVALPTMDPLWLYKDMTETIWNNFYLRDTCRTRSLFWMYPTDTGDAYDGEYVNFDYQFSLDTIKIIDEFDSSTVLYSDYRPGYAGFKIDWDDGACGFTLAKYKYLAFTYKGPLPNHKITVRFGYNSGCGSATFFQTMGTVNASATWKRDSIRIPDSVRNIPEKEKKDRSYYEMQVLINNVDPNDSPTSPPGNLKMDDIALVDTTSGADPEPEDDTKNSCGCGSGTAVAFIPPLWFKAMAFRRRKRRYGAVEA
ncbi:MAG: hypothetical protein JXA18_02115 [Chitinispirillaceae bacterium]|nr:hypothetical protein [Chitinispirillaceae bacterium]